MSPLQVLWINLVASVVLSLPIAFDVLEPGAMSRPPRRPDAPVFGTFVLARTALAACVMAAGACGSVRRAGPPPPAEVAGTSYLSSPRRDSPAPGEAGGCGACTGRRVAGTGGG